MASLADKAILSGAENRPPLLEKDMYDSWRSIMEMYILNIQHGRIILELVEHGPLLWPSVTEDGLLLRPGVDSSGRAEQSLAVGRNSSLARAFESKHGHLQLRGSSRSSMEEPCQSISIGTSMDYGFD
nr:hypothetical protein [Tanacetum cinerariifolium]